MPYNIEDHIHKVAAWAAATAASASPVCRFKVEQGAKLLRKAGFNRDSCKMSDLPNPESVDKEHLRWRKIIIREAEKENLSFTHGIAAKLINTYLKLMFVCRLDSKSSKIKAIHPPVDSIMLRELERKNVSGKKNQWRRFHNKRWSKFSSEDYQELIDLIKQVQGNSPLWKIEEHWQGHQ
jgi:hypothetical protein